LGFVIGKFERLSLKRTLGNLAFDTNLEATPPSLTDKLNEFNGKVGEGVRLTEVELRQFAQLAAQKVDDVTALIHLEKLLQWPAG